jgi:hypothetical protein
VRGKVLLIAACGLALGVSAAEPAGRPARVLLAVAGGGTASLLTSSDGVRFSAPVASWPGTLPSPVRRNATLYVYDSPTLSPDGLSGTVRRFAVGAGGGLTQKGSAAYTVQLASPEDATRATAGSFAPSFGVDEAGALVLLYGLRFEPATNACPAAGRACVKIRTATEVSGSDGTAFAGDPGNRVVIGLAAAETIGPPALLRTSTGWAALLRGPAGCLHLLTGRDLRGHWSEGCVAEQSPGSPSALWSPVVHEYRLYGVAAGRVVRMVSRRIGAVVTARFRPLDVGGRPSFARVVENSPQNG